MESPAKAAGGFNGCEGRREGGSGGVASHFRNADFALRVAGVVTTLAAAVVMGLAKEETTVQVQLSPALPAVPVTVTAKSSYSSAFEYFVVANAGACAYAVLSLVLSAASRGGRAGLAPALFAGDLLMAVLLVSGDGAAAAIGVVGRNGNPHVKWNKICNVFCRFCARVTASIGVSLLGSTAFVLLVLIGFLSVHGRSK